MEDLHSRWQPAGRFLGFGGQFSSVRCADFAMFECTIQLLVLQPVESLYVLIIKMYNDLKDRFLVYHVYVSNVHFQLM